LLLLSITLATWLCVFLPAPVLAIDDPDTAPQIRWVGVYGTATDGLLEDGDMGFLIDYYLDYADLPDETVTDAYLVTLIDTDGTTQLCSVAPYTFQDSGYGRGLAWIYFSTADVASYGLSYSSNYTIWLVGNPTLSWAGDPPKTTATIDYREPSSGDTADLLADRTLYFADILELAWSLDMIESTSVGEKLTTIGESYFVNVVASLRTMAPDAFSAGEIDPVTDNGTGTFGTKWADKLVTDSLTTPLDFSTMATKFHVSRGALTGMIWLVFMGAVLYFVVMYLGTKVAMLFCDVLIATGALLGMLPWALFIGLGVFAVLLTAWILFYRPSNA
jgi:hypothetical protein